MGCSGREASGSGESRNGLWGVQEASVNMRGG